MMFIAAFLFDSETTDIDLRLPAKLFFQKFVFASCCAKNIF